MTTPFDIAYLHPGTVHTVFADSLTETIRAYPKTKALPMSAKRLVLNKNVATNWWLNNSTTDWLLWIDQDMGWEPEDIQHLLDTAEEKGPAVISALCFGYMNGQIYPGFFVERDGNRLKAVVNQYMQYPKDEAFEVDGTGGGFMLLHRNIFQAMYNEPHLEGYPYFYAQMENGKPHGYAQFFCKLATDLGFKIWIEPRAEVKHHQDIPLTSYMYDRWWGRTDDGSN